MVSERAATAGPRLKSVSLFCLLLQGCLVTLAVFRHEGHIPPGPAAPGLGLPLMFPVKKAFSRSQTYDL